MRLGNITDIGETDFCPHRSFQRETTVYIGSGSNILSLHSHCDTNQGFSPPVGHNTGDCFLIAFLGGVLFTFQSKHHFFVENVKPLQQHRCAIYANEYANVDFVCKALYNRAIRKGIQSMAVTIKDIAAAAGVSPSTVSRTCKDSPSISRDTKERIRRIMAQMGYEPNFEAEPSEAFSKTIGIILPSSQRDVYENAFHLEIIRGIGQFCNQRRYVNTVITGEDDAEVLDAIQSMVANTQADGFILLYSKKDCPVAAYLRSEGLLHVIVGKAAQSANQTIYIDNDNALAGEEATDYLYEMGHRRIAYFGVSNAMLFSAERKRGYQMSLLKHGITPREGDCVEIDTLNDSYEPALKALLTAPDRPTAVLVSDDILAVVLEQFCNKLGLRIPKDLSIVSFNNSLFSRITNPPLTTVDVNPYQLGIEAASQTINHIENPNLLATKIIVPHQLIQRESCCPPPEV